jgi:nicotinamide-nucleotide amidase
MGDENSYRLAEQVGKALSARGLLLATAESCTGGGIGATITAVPGSSQWYERGFITYSNEAKRDMLGVSADALAQHGAVSEVVVREMARGALRMSRAQVALAVSGIAGPGGGSADKPVGTVCFAWAWQGGMEHGETLRLAGDRAAVRRQAAEIALQGLLRLLEEATLSA